MKKLVGAAILSAAVILGGANDPAFAKKIKWKMGSAFGSKVTQLGTLGVNLSKTVKAVSGGQFVLKFYEPKALAGTKEYFDAIAAGSIDAAYTTAGYYQGKEPALALFSAVPFGPSAGEYTAWIYHGGGHAIYDKIYAKHGLKGLICGVIAPEASGWFKKEINSVDDLKGLKMRFFGLGAKVMQKLGVETQLLAGGDIFPALERGTIDAAEFSMPAIDLAKGFYQAGAKHYYFPGWHQQATLFELLMNKEQWEGLSDQNKAILQTSCKANLTDGISEGEAIQGAALATLKSKGVQIHTWSPEILGTLQQTWNGIASESAAKDANFKEAWDSLQKFHAEYKIWKDLGYLN